MRLLQIWSKILSFTLLTYSASLLLFCSGGGSGSNAKEPSQEPEPIKIILVKTYRILAGDAAEKITATGTIKPWNEVVVSSETSGKITEVFMELGDRIKKGDVIVQVDKELKQLALEQAEAQLINAEAAYQKARRDLQRSEKLFKDASLSEFELENARLQEQVAKSAWLSAKAAVKMAQRQLRDTRIESPIHGLVAECTVDLGGAVAPGTPIAKIVDISKVKVRIGISEDQVVRIKKGQEVEVIVDAYPEARFKGRVFAVGPEADQRSRLFPVEIVLKNPQDSQLKSGMVARVTVASKVIQNVPLIPQDAVLERAGEYIAFVVNSNKAERRTLSLGIQSGDMIEVKDGVDIGEEVVVVGQENLSDGMRVEVQRE